MSKVTKSPLRIIRLAYKVGSKVLPEYRHRFSPRKYKQAQLFACLVLKVFLKTDYRGVEAMLRDLPELANSIGLKEIPHFTTLQKSEAQLLKTEVAKKLLKESIFFDAGRKSRNKTSSD